MKRPKCLKSGRSSASLWLSYKCFRDFYPEKKKKEDLSIFIISISKPLRYTCEGCDRWLKVETCELIATRPRERTTLWKGFWMWVNSSLFCDPLSEWLQWKHRSKHTQRKPPHPAFFELRARRCHLHFLIMMNKQTCWELTMSPLSAQGSSVPEHW